eukprot:scaffold21155_cov62-Isochrysis_galbana.AAC.1
MATWAVRIPPRPRPRSPAGVTARSGGAASRGGVVASPQRHRRRSGVEVERAAGSEETPKSQMKSHERQLKMRGWMLKPALYQSKPAMCQSNFRENASIFSSAKQIADQNRSNISDDGRFHAINAKSQTNFDLDLA